MDELIAFLNARLDEDEAAAAAVWQLGHTTDMGGNRLDERFSIARAVPSGEDGSFRLVGDVPASAHFLRHDPARVLADVAAKRAIIDAYELSERAKLLPGDNVFGYHATGLLIAIRHLATVYAGHPDYHEEWRP